MNIDKIISTLILDRENTLSVRSMEVVKTLNSMANPCLRVGTLPYYDWSKNKVITYVITYGRYLSCDMLVYDKDTKKDKGFIYVTGKEKAIKVLTNIINSIK